MDAATEESAVSNVTCDPSCERGETNACGDGAARAWCVRVCDDVSGACVRGACGRGHARARGACGENVREWWWGRARSHAERAGTLSRHVCGSARAVCAWREHAAACRARATRL